MISLLKGQIHTITEKEITLQTTGGVGYAIFPAGSLLAKLKKGQETEIQILTIVRETEISLYGFGTKEEKALFQKVITVSGIGPKMGLSLVSTPPQSFRQAVENGDTAFLTKIPGLGKKTAERLIIELRGKIDLSPDTQQTQTSPAISEATQALENLGYDTQTIKTILETAPENKTAEDLVKYFLSHS